MAVKHEMERCYNSKCVAKCVIKIVKIRRNITEIKRDPARYRNMSYIMQRLLEEGLITLDEMKTVEPNRLQLVVNKKLRNLSIVAVMGGEIIMNVVNVMQDVI